MPQGFAEFLKENSEKSYHLEIHTYHLSQRDKFINANFVPFGKRN